MGKTKISRRLARAILCEIAFMDELKKLSNDELVNKALKESDLPLDPIVDEIFDRLSPGWEDRER